MNTRSIWINNDVWRFYTTEDGMLDGEIYDMHQDKNSIWFANSNMGIWKLDLDYL